MTRAMLRLNDADFATSLIEQPRECGRLRILAVRVTGDLKNGERKQDKEVERDATFGRSPGAVGTLGWQIEKCVTEENIVHVSVSVV